MSSALYTKTNASACALAPCPERTSDRLQIFGSGFAAAPIGLDIKRKLLPLVEAVHAGTLDRRNVNEHIGAAVVLNDEAIALLGVEEFNSTCGHQRPPFKNAQRRRSPYKPFRMGRISGFCVFLAKAVRPRLQGQAQSRMAAI